ncbi:MAG: methionyl-tRNA formyltransferase [Deltaproteobacteria bacterium]|nr:methionyl-tRNA formyltransferase [Deltaproteobacteria bacterium]
MGSPEFAVPSLEAMLARHEVVLVVTQPDKPAGRGAALTAPPIKVVAERAGVPVLQPKSARAPEVAQALAATGAELGVVVAYGKILPEAVLTAFPRGCINVHGSILPRYRGAAPIQRAVMNGDAETGIAIMQLDVGMDTGPVLLERRTPIGPRETAGELFARLAPLGAEALVEAIDGLVAGTLHPVAQDHTQATHAAMLTKADGVIDFSRPAAAVAAQIRGVDPWPGALVQLRRHTVKVFGAVEVEAFGTPGTVLAVDARGLIVACGQGAVAIDDLQLPGRKRLSVAQVAQGRGVQVGDVLERALLEPRA